MIIKNVKIYRENHSFCEGDIAVRGGLFDETGGCLAPLPGEEILEGEGCYGIPGLIDMHLHGCMGYDVCDGTREAWEKIAAYELSVGVTAIAPATMTLSLPDLYQVLEEAAAYKKSAAAGADLVGINMEGPFISKAKKGAQDPRNIIPCDTEIAGRFLDRSEGLVKFIGIAPETSENAIPFIRQMKDRVGISLAHTNADYDTARAAFEAGANHLVHLYNAMPPFHHREPGVIGAAMDSPRVMTEIICDGVHSHGAGVRAAMRLFGADRMIMISDSMRATGLKDGQYTLGGLDVQVKGSHATLMSDGALAGSVTNLTDCLRIAVLKMGIPLETAVACASANPAKCLGIYDQYGSVTGGKKADLLLLDQDLRLKYVIKDGRIQ